MGNSNDSFDKLFNAEKQKNLRQLTPGEKIRAVVAGISGESIFLDVGGKSEGILAAQELADAEGNITVEPGDTLEVYFLQNRCFEQIFTTTLGACSSSAHLEEAWHRHIPVKGHVKAEVKGGFEINLGGNTRAFCPYSQMGIRRVEDASATYLDNHMTFRITRFEKNGRNIVLSARAILEEERELQKKELQKTLTEGQAIPATITSIRDFGAFADIGGVDGLIPLSEIGWSKVVNIHDHFFVGQEIDVIVKSIDWKNDRVSLSIKETLENPWDVFRENFPIGSQHVATVSRLVQFGAFVSLTEDIDGLIHISKLGNGRRISHPQEVVEKGQNIEIVVESIDDSKRRVSLTPVDYQTPADQDYIQYVSTTKKPKNPEIGSFGTLLKAKLKEKK